MCEESDDEKCNCIECYNQPNRAFRISKEIKPEISGLRRGFYLTKKDADDSLNTQSSENPSVKTVFISAAASSKEAQSAAKKSFVSFTPETIECETILTPEIPDDIEKIELKCVKSKCIENNDTIDRLNQGAFRVACTDGCTLTMHRNCFEKALGSGKKKELKRSICPTDACGSLVHRIDNRVPGKDNDFTLWLRCEGKEPERPKKEEKNKDNKKKDERKEKDKYKKDRSEGEDVRKVEKRGEMVESTVVSAAQERALISLTRPNNASDEDAKRNLVKPLPADLNARPIERKEDALMSKYAVKEANTKEIRKKNKKEVRQVVLPGLTVKGQRWKKDEEEEPVSVNEDSIQNGGQMETPELRYDEGSFGFAMPEEVDENAASDGEFVDGGRSGSSDINAQHNPFEHPLSFGHGCELISPTIMQESQDLFNHSNLWSQPHNPRQSSLSTFTVTAATDGPPLIENPYDYPTLEKDSIRERKELVNFFETHTPVLEENAALFDSPRIDLEQLRNMLESFIEFQFYGNYEEKNNMTETLRSIFAGEVENDIIPFLMDLHCFKCGYVDGRLVVSVKTEGKERREREDQLRKGKEDEERRLREEEYNRRKEIEEGDRRREAKKVEEVRRAVLEIEEKRRREDEERKLIEEESIRMEKERQRKKNEEKRRIEDEATQRKKMIENKLHELEEKTRVSNETEQSLNLGDERNILEEKRRKEEENREKTLLELVDSEVKWKRSDLLRQKDVLKKTKEKALERKTRGAILDVRGRYESKHSSSESSPERKELLMFSALRSTAPPFVPRTFLPKAELNPNAPTFIPSHSAKEAKLFDDNGTEVDEMWVDANTLLLQENKSTIDKLKIRVSELEADKFKMEAKIRLAELEMSKNDGLRVNEDRKKYETISQLEAQIRGMNEQIAWKNTEISEIIKESERKSEQLNLIRSDAKSKLEEMKLKMIECNLSAIKERTEKENVMTENMRVQVEKKKWILERKIACAKDAISLCGCIIDKLAMEPEAQVMTSTFIELRRKWMKHFSTLQHSFMGDNADWQSAISLEEPSMPQETDALVKECYVFHYLAIHTMSFRLAALVKKYLRDHRRYYEDAFVIGIIRKWMRSHMDPSKIEATIPQVANMVTQAMGDSPLIPPKYVHVASQSSSVSSIPSTPTRIPTLHTDRMTTTQLGTQSASNKNEPKGWKKASDKVRHVDFNEHECSICLEGTDGGNIAYCEQTSCNEPYHNNCLDQYWKTGGRNCPRCRTPMPPRDAYPALG